MRRQIRWTTREDDGVKRYVRVAVSKNDIKWQFKRADEGQWDYDTPPRADDWDLLELEVQRRFQRGLTSGNRELDLVRRKRQAQGV